MEKATFTDRVRKIEMLDLLESLHMEKSSTSQPNFPYVVKREECFLQSTIEVPVLA